MNLIGITTDTLTTVGSTELTFFENPIKFQVIAEELPLPVTGILGVDFLKKESAEISFHHNALITASRPISPIRFINHEVKTPKTTNFILSARTRTPICIELKDTNLTTGYIQRIQAPEHVFIGNAAVTNRNGKCFIMAINASEEDVELEIPPQELEPFDILDESENVFGPDDMDAEPVEEKDRLETIINSLRLDYLNSEEKENVLNIIEDYPDLFHLPADYLPATNV